MQAYDYEGEKALPDSIEARDYRALTRSLTVLPDYDRAAGAEDLYVVVSDSGKEYLVDARDGACECPDHEYRDARCLHLRRVAFATGERAIPDSVAANEIDDQLGLHVAGEPRQAATDGGEIIEAGDEGEILEADDDEAEDERPADCDCAPFLGDLPCWPCYREGFDVPNPEAVTDD